jgi:topoisomerase IV subunit B
MGSPRHNYDESKVQTLSALEHIRRRSGMYIGRIGDGAHFDDGIYVLLKEIVDNAIDEFIMGFGRRIEISVRDGKVAVRDHGRGIPLGKVVDCVSTINTGAKYNDDVFQFSVGLNGVGTKAVNALSSSFRVRSHRGGRFAGAAFVRGRLAGEEKGATKEPDGTLVEFTPDPEIFGAAAFREEHVRRRLQLGAYLHAGLTLEYNGAAIVSARGLLDLIEEEAAGESLYEPFHRRDRTLEIAFTHSNRFTETCFSFVNGQPTADGGTHLSAFREGVLKAVNAYAKAAFDGDDVREGLVGAVAVRLKDPVFESQTKNKLGNPDLRPGLVREIARAAEDLLHRDPARAARLVEKVRDTGRLRKELQAVKKMARERSRAVSLRVPQLKDCRDHLDARRGTGRESMIFLTEGQSAAGSIVSCRDVATQAIFTLKGKPLNVCELERDALYKNDELYNLMRSLNIEDSVDGLRYQRVILATDADVDGLHIRNLMVTFFLRFFEPLVQRGHLWILETPLFRVRTKKQTRYCHREAERDEAMRELGRTAEVTRFKGLGEISPAEFRPFIGPAMRLTPVDVLDQHHVAEVLGFYMGRNTPERRDYIMRSLIVDNEAG